MGINTGRYKVMAFAISALPAGIAGSYLASYLSFVGPTNFTVDVSILAVEAVILGGMASLPGSILGSAILVIALEVLRSIAEFRKAFIGITIILLLVFRPQGLLGEFSLQDLLAKGARDRGVKPLAGDRKHKRTTVVSQSVDPQNAKVILQGVGVTKHFGGVQALQSLDFELHQGEILGLIGPNGSGKTTLFNVISGIFPATSGNVIFADKPTDGLPAHTFATRGLQRTFQNVRLFKRLSVLTNVKIGAHVRVKANVFHTLARTPAFRCLEREAEEAAYYWLTFVGLEHRADELARNLPYGEQKLLEMARALAGNPKVLLLDEPAAGLNANEVKALANVIRRIREMGITVFVVEHNMRLIMDICDRVIVINFGGKVTEGTPAQIQQNPAVQEAYLGT
jgi:branched-chain amino acid transport system permease protein